MNTKPMPGTPSRHLPLAAISASKRVLRASISSAANELIASTIRPRPRRSQIGDRLQRIQHAGAGLAVDQHHA